MYENDLFIHIEDKLQNINFGVTIDFIAYSLIELQK